ncbi:MAG: ABC transporter ATP-binding protein/permease [Ruminococcus sp.]|nr:ABC transporter ATP-binding protein/permease [Ruminococcus sp.]MCM1381985.1 ABC transporter ATP-binding protein/permease [Muribaculaceae bacterium]MCM1478400.1 ABC transporter ATP-binding protein/permease [Muribaculaceae bacterium]
MFKLAKKYLGAFKKELIIGPLAKFTEAVFELIVPLIMADIIDTGINGGAGKPYIYKMGGIMVLLGVLGLCCALVCQYLASKASQGVGTVIRNDLFRHINTLSHAELDRFGTPSLITRITGDVNQVQSAVAMLIRLVVRAPFLVIGAAVMAMTIDLKLSVIFLAVMPLVSLILYLVMSRSVPFYKVIQKKLDKISLITRESLTGARVIRAFSRGEAEEERFGEANGDYAETSMRVGRLSALLNPLTYAVMNLAIAAIVWFGGFRVDSGDLSQGQVIAFVNYMTQISLALVVVANLVVLFTKAAACSARINEVFDTSPSIVDGSGGEVRQNAPKIEFKNISFSYSENGDNALENISFSVNPGETVGVIGGTGSGKSTLVNLIPRFYDAERGEVLVDGVNVRDYRLEDLRKKIGVVPQKAVLFSGTVADNLRWGNENASTEDMEKAVTVAQAKEFTDKLPDGFDTEIAQGGRNLSGGQKQRLTIARALTGSPEILILDDSASALDFATDAALRKAIAQSTENMTVIIVSQRATSIRYADKIIVLDDGEAVGIGTHDQLMKACEVYREIVLSQEKTAKEGA